MNKVSKIILMLLIVILAISSYFFIKEMMVNKKETDIFDDLQEIVEKPENTTNDNQFTDILENEEGSLSSENTYNLENIAKIENMGYGNLPICIAKTQYSLSDDPKNLECRNDYNIRIRSIEIKNGAGFIVALAGKIMTMPGLPKVPAAENITLNENIEIEGIF